VASGDSCGAGALSAGAGSFASPLMNGWSFTAKLVTASVIGGVASVAGGGKFGNGAMTAAFGYLSRDAMSTPAMASIFSTRSCQPAPSDPPLLRSLTGG